MSSMSNVFLPCRLIHLDEEHGYPREERAGQHCPEEAVVAQPLLQIARKSRGYEDEEIGDGGTDGEAIGMQLTTPVARESDGTYRIGRGTEAQAQELDSQTGGMHPDIGRHVGRKEEIDDIGKRESQGHGP